jgi:hypothetical protein
MLKKLNTSKGNILEYEVEGELTQEEMEARIREMKETIREHGTVNLLIKARDTSNINYSDVISAFKNEKDTMDRIGKYALVTESSPLAVMEKLSGVMADLEYESFDYDEEEKARQWLRQPVGSKTSNTRR